MKPGIELDALIAEKVMGIPMVKGYRGYTAYASSINQYLPSTEFSLEPFDYISGTTQKITLLAKMPETMEEHFNLHFNPANPYAATMFQLYGYEVYPKSYSTDIVWAFKVVAKLSDNDESYFNLVRYQTCPLPREHKDWKPSQGADGPGYKQHYTAYFRGAYGKSETAPHAICLAALKAVE